MFQESVRVFQGTCFKKVSRVFQGRLKAVLRNLHKCLEGVLRVFQGSFNGVLMKFQRHFKEVTWMFHES